MKHYKKEWKETKIKYVIGSKIKGYSVVLYPQGVMIKGNDEKNMWLILK